MPAGDPENFQRLPGYDGTTLLNYNPANLVTAPGAEKLKIFSVVYVCQDDTRAIQYGHGFKRAMTQEQAERDSVQDLFVMFPFEEGFTDQRHHVLEVPSEWYTPLPVLRVEPEE